jgi:hypothetical protein
LRSRPHHQYLNYQIRDRSPVDFPRYAPRWYDYNREASRPEDFGFVTHFDDRFMRDNQPSSSRRGDEREYRCGENGFYFYNDDGCCYDDEGYRYPFDKDGFYYDTESGYRYDSGGFLCDEKKAFVLIAWNQNRGTKVLHHSLPLPHRLPDRSHLVQKRFQ